jgi:hypothetical protein
MPASLNKNVRRQRDAGDEDYEVVDDGRAGDLEALHSAPAAT